MGLVERGYPNLKFFNYLYWIITLTLITISFGVFPFTHHLAGEFPQNTPKGQICLNIDFKLDEMNTKQRLTTLIVPVIIGIYKVFFSAQMTNLKMETFSQFGGNQNRNLFTAQQTSCYFNIMTIIFILDNGLIFSMQLYQDYLERETRFILHNLLWVSFELFFGIYIPVKHLILSRTRLLGLWWERSQVQENFYVRKPEVIPRRSFIPPTPIREKAERKNCFTYFSKFPRNKINTEVDETILLNVSSKDPYVLGTYSTTQLKGLPLHKLGKTIETYWPPKSKGKHKRSLPVIVTVESN